MRIKSFSLTGYGSFSDSGVIELGDGINFFVGQNNTGKSVLLRSLATIEYKPHRSAEEFRDERLPANSQSIIASFHTKDIETTALKNNGIFDWKSNDQIISNNIAEIDDFFANEDVEFAIYRTPSEFMLVGDERWNAGLVGRFQYGKDGSLAHINWQHGNASMPQYVASLWAEKLFFFHAQRYNLGRSAIDHSARLNSDASNLPSVLLRMQGDQTDLFRILIQHMRDIFPTVKNLSVTNVRGTQELEILVWPTVEQAHRELSSGLNESGTGLSQVLAILTVAMTIERGIIVIDEISSFLHPAAAKQLVRILESHYPQHQYIISTHATDVLTACSPSSLHLITKEGFKSSVKRLSVDGISDIRLVASELGVSMTDVFASDRVVWVEGPTEEISFAYIYEHTRVDSAEERRATSPQFTSVVATGDFSSKRNRPELVFDIYDRLSSAAAILAGSATFAFDSEELTDGEKADLEKRANGRLMFLPRRHFECYLLSPSAIEATMNEALGDGHVKADDIIQYLLDRGGEKKFKAQDDWVGNLSNESWLRKVDAANLLKSLFSDLTEARLSYSKRNHSFAILKHALCKDRAFVEPLVSFVGNLVALART